MWSALISTTTTGFSGTGTRSLPDQRLLPPGARPVKPSPPTSGSSWRPISARVLVDPGPADVVQPSLLIVEGRLSSKANQIREA